jgi:hypothetical protein
LRAKLAVAVAIGAAGLSGLLVYLHRPLQGSSIATTQPTVAQVAGDSADSQGNPPATGLAQPNSASDTATAGSEEVRPFRQNPAAGTVVTGQGAGGARRIAGGASPAMGFGGGVRTQSPRRQRAG